MPGLVLKMEMLYSTSIWGETILSWYRGIMQVAPEVPSQELQRELENG